jgi:hypothetical protein
MRPQWVCCCVRPSREENTNTRTARSLDPADCVAPENFNSVSSKFDLTLSRVYFSHFYAVAVSILYQDQRPAARRCTLIQSAPWE